MISNKYDSNQLTSIIEELFDSNNTGIINLKANLPSSSQQRSGILILHQGALVYGDYQVPEIQELCKNLGRELEAKLVNTALPVAIQKAKNPDSIREILENLIKLKVFNWENLESLIEVKVLRVLDKFMAYPGELTWEPQGDFDLCYGADRHGLDWQKIKQKLKQRQQQWQKYAPQIPSMDAIPLVSPKQLGMIDSPRVKEHLIKSINGTSSLVEIAEKMGRDPLSVAKSYYEWSNQGWVSFSNVETFASGIRDIKEKISSNLANIQSQGTSGVSGAAAQTKTVPNNLPTVLSVDDSPIIQVSIKRALQDHYQVLLANKAAQALEILQEATVELMLLDLTMPDIDGLEFCRHVRTMAQFQDLPIIMVTARDGLVNKMKGRIAGSSRYLTKPFEAEELRKLVAQCINQ